MINSIFQELLYEGVLVNYINDFIISTKIKKKLEERNSRIYEIPIEQSAIYKES